MTVVGNLTVYTSVDFTPGHLRCQVTFYGGIAGVALVPVGSAVLADGRFTLASFATYIEARAGQALRSLAIL